MQVGVPGRRRDQIPVQGNRPLVFAKADRGHGMQALIMRTVGGILPQQPIELTTRLAVLLQFNEHFGIL